jgi:hypothetical protein
MRRGTKSELQEGLTELENVMYEALEKAKELYLISKDYRCFGGQLRSYLIGTLESFIDYPNQSGSIENLKKMLDNDEDGYDEDEEEDKEE